MNKHTIKGDWNQLKGSAKQKWADLTDDDLLHVEGSRDKLVGKVQERYGHSKDDAERAVDEWQNEHDK
ncbi:CsbD family protein [Psychrobacter frigidicola]|uniref:CsbD family protein n=1 Tax=Psychrobacter frigidicola TaxID=45611 RepID=A0A5C7A180_9GAMM|nr:CsbD family protein [Psychrobacter frigidicola]TXD96929.1 CsbD family protein [Psychrobacter frigidicola]